MSGLAEATRRAAAAVWRGRHRFELDAAARFERLAGALEALGGAAELVVMLAQAGADERRHAQQCEQLVAHFGGEALPDSYPTAAAAAPAGLTARDALTYELVAMACVTETLSCALLSELCERAQDDVVGAAMRAILRDEVRHSRVGWAYLASEGERLPRQLLSAALPAMLAATVPDTLFDDGAEGPLDAALGGLGSLPRLERLRIFEQTMRQVVFPGLRHFAIDPAAGEAWLSARTAFSHW